MGILGFGVILKEKETAKMEVWFPKQRIRADIQQNRVQVYPRSSSTVPDANKQGARCQLRLLPHRTDAPSAKFRPETGKTPSPCRTAKEPSRKFLPLIRSKPERNRKEG